MRFQDINRQSLSIGLAVASSLFLIISGTTGTANWIKTKDFVLEFLNFQILELPLIIMTIIASFGGLSVLIGAILIYREKFFWARLFIALGSGVGIISLAANLIANIASEARIESFNSFFSLSTFGVLLALASQISSFRLQKTKEDIN